MREPLRQPGIDALLKDKRVVAEIKGAAPVTVGDLTDYLQIQFFHGTDKPAQPRRMNARKEDALDATVMRRLLNMEALKLGIDKTPAYRDRVRGYTESLVFGAFLKQVIAPENKMRVEVLTESEKKKRQFLSRTIWAVGAAAAALVLVVLLFKTRAGQIEEFRAANAKLVENQKQNNAIRNKKDAAEADELDQRQKDMALRIRRLPGAFVRAIVDALHDSHNSDFIYIDKFLLATKKMSFGLDGKPGDPQANLGVSEEAKHNIHAQTLWPEIEVEGQLLEETPNVGGAILAYYTELKRNLAKLSVEGWKVDLKTTSPDKNKRFSMTFVLVPAEGS